MATSASARLRRWGPRGAGTRGVGSGPAGLGRTEVTEAGAATSGHCSATLFAFGEESGGRVAATSRAAGAEQLSEPSSARAEEHVKECSMLLASRPAAAVALAACLVCGVLVASASVTAAPVPADDATSTTPPIVATTTAISTSSASSTSSSSSGAGAARSLAARPGPLAQAAQALAPLGHLVKEAPDRVKEGLRKGADGLRGRIHGGLSRITGGTQSTNKVGTASYCRPITVTGNSLSRTW